MEDFMVLEEVGIFCQKVISVQTLIFCDRNLFFNKKKCESPNLTAKMIDFQDQSQFCDTVVDLCKFAKVSTLLQKLEYIKFKLCDSEDKMMQLCEKSFVRTLNHANLWQFI